MLPRFIWHSDHYPLVLFCVGASGNAWRDLGSVERDYIALDKVIKDVRD